MERIASQSKSVERQNMSEGPVEGNPEHNIYTMLLIIATVYVGAGTVFLAVKSQELFGSWNPFSATMS